MSREAILRKERRYARVVVILDDVAGGLIGLHRLTFEGIPKNSIFVGAMLSPEYYGVSFIYAHEEFEPVPEGGQVPVKTVTVTKHQPYRSNVKSRKD